MPLQMPHVSVCDSHNELPQSKHCVLAVLEQGKPSASAEFLISTISQWLNLLVRRLAEITPSRSAKILRAYFAAFLCFTHRLF